MTKYEKICVFCNSKKSEHEQQEKVEEKKIKHDDKWVRIFTATVIGKCNQKLNNHEDWEVVKDYRKVVNFQGIKVTHQGSKEQNLQKAVEKLKSNPQEFLESIEVVKQ